MKDAGATVDTIYEGKTPLNHIKFSYGDESFKILEKWVNDQPNFDPLVHSVFHPSQEIENSVLCPPIALGIMIQREASSVVHHYRTLRAEDFEGVDEPVIGNIVPGVGASNVHHATIAVSRLGCAIQNCPYDTIRGLKAGSYICDLYQTWANTVFSMAVFKPCSNE
jgi:hypothetical protein